MSSQNTNLRFDTLKDLPDWEVKNLKTNNIIAVCIDALAKNEYDGNIIFDYGLTKILSSHRLKEVDNNYLHQFLAALLDHVSKLLLTLEYSLNEADLKQLLTLITKHRDFLVCLMDLTKLVDIRSVYIAVELSLRIVERNYVFFRNSKDMIKSTEPLLNDLLNQILIECQTFQRVTINIIADNLQYFINNSITDSHAITKIINCLCCVGEFILLIDVKSTADIWKCISRLGTENSAFMKESTDRLAWLEQPVKYLCEEISQSVTAILENYDENDSQADAKLTRILKINSFYLKVIIKFATDFEHQYFQGCEHVFKLSILLNSLSDYPLQAKIVQQINQYLTVGVINLISQIYNNEIFAKVLSDADINNLRTFQSYCTISFVVMQLIIESNDASIANLYFQRNGNKTMFDNIFDKIPTYNILVLKRQNYENLVTIIAAMLISTCDSPRILQHFETKLVQGILQNNIMLGLISYDIWCILFRFATEHIRLQYFKFWLKFILNRPIFSNRSEAIFVDVLIKSLYSILSEKQKESIWIEYSNSEENIIKMAFVLGVGNIFNKTLQEKMFGESLTNLDSDLNVLLKEPSKESYYEVAKHLQLVSVRGRQIDAGLAEKVNNIWIRLANGNVSNDSLLISLINFISATLTNSESILNSLHDFSGRFSNKNIKFYILKLLKIYNTDAKNINREKLSKIINTYITLDDKLLSIYCTYYFPTQRSITNRGMNQNSKQVLDYFLELCKLNVKHSCFKGKVLERNDNCTSDGNSSKRLKRDNANLLLAEATQNVEKVGKYFRNCRANKDEILQIQLIVDTFNEIIKNSNV